MAQACHAAAPLAPAARRRPGALRRGAGSPHLQAESGTSGHASTRLDRMCAVSAPKGGVCKHSRRQQHPKALVVQRCSARSQRLHLASHPPLVLGASDSSSQAGLRGCQAAAPAGRRAARLSGSPAAVSRKDNGCKRQSEDQGAACLGQGARVVAVSARAAAAIARDRYILQRRLGPRCCWRWS